MGCLKSSHLVEIHANWNTVWDTIAAGGTGTGHTRTGPLAVYSSGSIRKSPSSKWVSSWLSWPGLAVWKRRPPWQEGRAQVSGEVANASAFASEGWAVAQGGCRKIAREPRPRPDTQTGIEGLWEGRQSWLLQQQWQWHGRLTALLWFNNATGWVTDVAVRCNNYLICSTIIKSWESEIQIITWKIEGNQRDWLTLFPHFSQNNPWNSPELLLSLFLSSLATLLSPPRILSLILVSQLQLHPLIQGCFIGTVDWLFRQFSYSNC